MLKQELKNVKVKNQYHSAIIFGFLPIRIKEVYEFEV